MATATRDDFAIFVPMTRRIMTRRNMRDPVFERVAEGVLRRTNTARNGHGPSALRALDDVVTTWSALNDESRSLVATGPGPDATGALFEPQPPLATATSGGGGALPDAPGAHPTRAFANLALRASREAEAMRELSQSRAGGAPGGRSRTPGPEYAAGDSVYRGGSGRGEGSHYGGRSPRAGPERVFAVFAKSPGRRGRPGVVHGGRVRA